MLKLGSFWLLQAYSISLTFEFLGTSVIQVTASDADDPTYGNSAKLVYSILEGQPYFSVEPQTGISQQAFPKLPREETCPSSLGDQADGILLYCLCAPRRANLGRTVK